MEAINVEGALPEGLECAACGVYLELDPVERIEKRFTCPECGTGSDFARSGEDPRAAQAAAFRRGISLLSDGELYEVLNQADDHVLPYLKLVVEEMYARGLDPTRLHGPTSGEGVPSDSEQCSEYRPNITSFDHKAPLIPRISSLREEHSTGLVCAACGAPTHAEGSSGPLEVLGATFSLIGRHLASLRNSFSLFVGPPLILFLVIGVRFPFVVYLYLLGADTSPGPNPPAMVVSFMAWVVVVWVVPSLVISGHVLLHQERGPAGISARAVGEMVRDHFLTALSSVLVLSLLTSIASLVVLGVTFYIGGLLGVVLAFVLSVGGLYAGSPLALLVIVRVREGVGLAAGVRRCLQLVAGSRRRTFAVVLYSGVTYIVLGVSLTATLIAVELGVGPALDLLGIRSEATVVIFGLELLGLIVLLSVPFTAVTLQYYNLVTNGASLTAA